MNQSVEWNVIGVLNVAQLNLWCWWILIRIKNTFIKKQAAQLYNDCLVALAPWTCGLHYTVYEYIILARSCDVML